MKRRKWMVIACLFLLSILAFTGCNRSGGETVDGRPFYQIEVFNTYSNFMGINAGWWGHILRETLNMELNLISPQVAGTGDTLYQTRTAAGNLGDLIVVSKGRMLDLQQAGLLYNARPLLANAPNVREKLAVAYERFAEEFPGDGIYAFPGRVSVLPPTTPAGRTWDPEHAHFLRYDWYINIGLPEIRNADHLIDVVERMVQAHPVNENGDRTFGFSFFPDWDGGSVRAAREMLMIHEGFTGVTDLIFSNWDGSQTIDIFDNNSLYFQWLQRWNRAYRRGLVDVDSATQNWDMSRAKFIDGRVAYGFWQFQADSIFTRLDLTRRSPYAVVPVQGQQLINPGFNPYGLEGNAWAIGSRARFPDRIMEFMDWVSSDEGILIWNSQIEGLTYTMVNGVPVQTEYGIDNSADKQAPANLGGGLWSEGIQRINFPLTHSQDPNPLLNGFPTSSSFWPGTVDLARQEWNTQWRAHYNAEHPLELLEAMGILQVRPGTDYTAPVEPSEISTARAQIRNLVVPAGWRMIYAATDAEFMNEWNQMRAQLNDFGYQEVLNYDRPRVVEMNRGVQDILRQFGR
ncbi:MAG: hypothetical protein FWH12_01185 [Treponema sp.]|nr:hypothetical protein [Treponema sp.]